MRASSRKTCWLPPHERAPRTATRFPGARAAARPGHRAADAAAGRDTAAARLHVYEHAYLSRLVEALGRSYGILRVALGTVSFDELATAFAHEVPSRHRSIRDYGGELSAFILRQRRDGVARTWSELAAWEWLLADVFDAADAIPLTPEALAPVPPDHWAELRFRAHPTLRRYSSTTNAVEIWRTISVAQIGAQVSPADGLAAVVCQPPVEWLAWRHELTTNYRSLEAAEANALDALLAHSSFGDICVRLAETGDADQAPLRCAQYLRGWIETGLVAGLQVGPPAVE